MNAWILFLIASTALTATGFVVVSVLWLKKLREALSLALKENAHQQVRTAQRFGETLGQMQRQQQLYERRLETLTDANIRMRQDINLLAGKIALTERDGQEPPGSRLLH